jgi:short-subunit dehydrogenase
MSNFKEKCGPWAIVTGASSGIGVEFCKQLAAKGLNIVLVARRAQEMQALSDELNNKYGISTQVVPLDLAQEGFFDTLKVATEGLDVGLVVNNAGINCEGHFYRGDLQRNLNMLRLNTEAPFIIAYEMGKLLMERKRGGIIFTSSTSAFQATPFLSHYGATKAYILSLAESMNYEFKEYGVDVLAVCPGMTESEMTRGMKQNPLLMKAEPVVKLALDKLGKEPFVIPGFPNQLQVWLTKRVFSRTLGRDLTGAIMKRTLPGVRRKKTE